MKRWFVSLMHCLFQFALFRSDSSIEGHMVSNCLFSVFFRAHWTNDLTKKFEKVGPFECDELGNVVWLLEKQKDPPPGRVVNARN